MLYYIRIEYKEGTAKKYFQFKDKQRALQIYEYIIDNYHTKENVKLMDKDFNPVLPFQGRDTKSFVLYQ